MKLPALALGLLLAAAPAASVPDERATDAATLESYRAHVGAAEAALRLHEVAAARDWLDTAPLAPRGWEWRHLDQRVDRSLARVVAHEGGTVFGLRVSADGRRLVTAGFDGTARVWDATTLGPASRPAAVLAGHAEGLWAAAFVGDGGRIVTASGDRTARLFDGGSGEALGTLWANDTPVSCVDVSPDGSRIAASAYRWVLDGEGRRVAVEGQVALFDAATGEPLRRLVGGEKPISQIRFSPDGARIAASCWDAKVHVWDVASETPALSLDLQEGEVYSAGDALAWSPDGTRIAAGSKAGQVRLFDAASGERLATLVGHVGHLGGVAFHPGGRRLASGGEDGTVRHWDAADGRCLAVLHGHLDQVHGVAFAPDGERLYTASADGTLRCWPGDPSAAGDQVLTHRSAYTLGYSPDGARLASSSYDGRLRIWDTAAGAVAAEFELGPGSLNVVAFDGTGTRLAAARSDGTAVVVEAATGEVMARIDEPGRGAAGVAFSPDDRRVALLHDDDAVRLFDADTGAEAWRVEGAAGPRNSLGGLAFLPDGRLASPFGEVVRLLDVEDGATSATLAGAGGRVRSVAVTPGGGRLLASADGGRVAAWDAVTGELLWSGRGHATRADRVRVSPDGSRAVSVAHDLVVWDVGAGAPLLRLRLDANSLYDAAFSPDGTRVAVLGSDDRIVVLDSRQAPD